VSTSSGAGRAGCAPVTALSPGPRGRRRKGRAQVEPSKHPPHHGVVCDGERIVGMSEGGSVCIICVTCLLSCTKCLGAREDRA
jgi:hypothetical protein